jgi:serine/threonine-protein kinase
MTTKARMLLTAVTLLGCAAVVLSLKVIGGPTALSRQPDRSSTVTMPTTPSSIARPPVESSPTGVSEPSLVQLPDRFGATCGSGITFPGQDGWPTRAGRGTPETSCVFAVNVLQAYRSSDPSSDNAARTATAASVVPCPDFGEQCGGPPIVLNCAIDEKDRWVTCSDGSGAKVLLFRRPGRPHPSAHPQAPCGILRRRLSRSP